MLLRCLSTIIACQLVLYTLVVNVLSNNNYVIGSGRLPEYETTQPHGVSAQHRKSIQKWILFFIAVFAVIVVSAIPLLWLLLSLKTTVISSVVPPYCQTLHMKSRTPINTFVELYRAVADVGDWEGLCLNLDVDEAAMDILKHSQSSTHESKKRECLKAYWKTGEAIWETVIQAVALYPITNIRLAKEIANGHSIAYTCGRSVEL